MKKLIRQITFAAAVLFVGITANAQSISVQELKGKVGENLDLSICLNNGDTQYKGIQFDVVLPKGVSFITEYDEDEEVDVIKYELNSTRLTKTFTLVSKTLSETQYRFVCYNPNSAKAKIKEAEGEIFKLFIEISTTAPTGSNFVKIQNISLSTTDDESVDCDNANIPITILGADEAAATMKVGAGNTYGTFCAPIDVKIPNGIKAYTAEVKGENVVLTQVESTIAAGTAVIVEYTQPTAFEMNFTGEQKKIDETCQTGCLVGTFTSQQVPLGAYVLQNHSGVEAFYVVTAESGALMTRANGCYLTTNAASGVRAFSFGDDTTGINAVCALVGGSAAIYDASGVKRDALRKGVNIVRMADGTVQKVMVK